MAKTKIYSNKGQKVKELSGPTIRGNKYPGTIDVNKSILSYSPEALASGTPVFYQQRSLPINPLAPNLRQVSNEAEETLNPTGYTQTKRTVYIKPTDKTKYQEYLIGKKITDQTTQRRNIHTNQPVISPYEAYAKQKREEQNVSEIAKILKANQEYAKAHSDIYIDPQTGKQVIQNIGIKPTASPIDAAVLGVGALYSGGAGLFGSMVELANPLPVNPLKVGKGLKNFKSEINWAKWNKEIPKNKTLMQEYNAIEQQAKANGTWMKNTDGSAFQGTPEQFIQQRSSSFKKYYGNTELTDYYGNPQIVHNSSFNDFDVFKNDLSTIDNNFYFSNSLDKSKQYGDKTRSVYLSDKSIKTDMNPYEYTYGSMNRKAYGYKGKDVNVDIMPGGDEYITKNPNIIKSAIGNNGMFDMTNPNIYKSLLPIGIGARAYMSTTPGVRGRLSTPNPKGNYTKIYKYK